MGRWPLIDGDYQCKMTYAPGYGVEERQMTYYIVMTGDGDLLCDGVSEYEIDRVAQEWANRLAQTVYYSESGGTDTSYDEDRVTAVEPR